VIELVAARGLAPTDDQRRTISTERDPARLRDWLLRASTCASVDDLLGKR
jgi:hypothetical protein